MDLIFEPQKRKPFTIEVGYFDTVEEIKQKVEKYQRIPVSDQTLVFNGQVLPDDGDIASCVLLHNSRINLIIASDEKTVSLNVKIPTPEQHVATIEIDVDDTVLNLKNKILQVEKTLAAANRSLLVLHSKGPELQDHRTFGECEVSDGAEIEVSSRRPVSNKKLKVILQSKCETMRIPVEVNPADNVMELRKECQRLNQEVNFPLPPEGYFFIHKQAVMDDNRSFWWHNVGNGNIIEVFPGSVSGGS
ncbi:hypothetical protein L484_014811 [Morus notabilis]|uniref:Ubiquitin-like domain-containing protein n=1 Tax=Morus notabilis TaxID=981085 RepID=W9QEX4_9ROSA|nr:ubiquitin domain-containing protein 7SL RNA1 [Morus notabilis]EXB31384.1 hypothetical protein L484_014811 [Morus notabilis]